MGMRVKGWGAGLSVNKTAHEPVDLLLGTLQVVVDHDMVEARRKGKLVGSLAHALLDGLGGVGGTRHEAAAQLVDRGWLDKDAQGTVAIEVLDVASALDIDIEEHVFSALCLGVYLALEGAVEAALIDLLVLEELVGSHALTELVGRDEEILDAVLLGASRRARCAADGEREMELGVCGHEPLHQGALARARWCAEYNEFAWLCHD